MKTKFTSRCAMFAAVITGLLAVPAPGRAGHYTNFNVSIYMVVSAVNRAGSDLVGLTNQWRQITNQVMVDKVYIEVQRDRRVASDATLEAVKKFFLDQGVKVGGGMCLSDGNYPGGGQFKSFCYTDPDDRAFIKSAAQLAARHFDEVIQDDFFFVTTKFESDISAKGNKSWTDFRMEMMDRAAQELIVGPAKEVNPRVKMIVKFPNWYEHFAGSGFDLVKEPGIFDGIYTGTETREPTITDQNLQPYESYEAFRYFENIKPGGNGGGWVDTFDLRHPDRYAEQLCDTVFARAPEIMLFAWPVAGTVNRGWSTNWQHLPTSFNYDDMLASARARGLTNATELPFTRVAGYALEQADAILSHLGQPIGIPSYRPGHALGEDFLHNYFGMIGIPIELYPEFPTNAPLVLLTQAAAADPDIVAKIKNQLIGGKSVVITSGLFRALRGRGIEDIVELQYNDRKILAHRYDNLSGAGGASVLAGEQEGGDILFPMIEFLTNDAWQLVRALTNGKGYPLLLLDHYGRSGLIYVWTMPDDFNDLYRLPPTVVSALKNHLMGNFPFRLDGPNQVALLAYDNHTCIAQNFLPAEAEVRIGVTGNFTKLKNLATGEVLNAQAGGGFGRSGGGFGGRRGGGLMRATFNVHLLPHSYAAFEALP
jgi:hypothetical protein